MSMTTIECRGILFDMDGVLVDSTPAVARVWTAWALQHGMEPNDVVRRAHGRPSISTVRELLPDGDHQAENDEIERREIEDVDGVIALPGAAELLTTLAPDRWAVVTSATRALAEIRIRAGGLPLPKNFVTVDDITHGKPNPEPYLKGAQLLGLAPAACVVMEDAPAGIRAGKAAGARVVALQTTERDELLRDAGADWIVKDCSSVQVDESSPRGEITLQLNRFQ